MSRIYHHQRQAIRRAQRDIEGARFLVHHQYLGQAVLIARRAIFELESVLFDGPLIPSTPHDARSR